MPVHRYTLASRFLAFGLLMLLGFGGQSTPAQRQPKRASTIRVAVCQTLCIDSDRAGNLRRIEYALQSAADQNAQIACFPETALLGWINPDAHELADPIPGKTTDRLSSLAKKHGLMITIGLCEKDGENLHDSVVLIGPDGTLLAKHRKINVLAELMDPPYAKGNIAEITVVETPLGRIGMLICADTFKDDLVERIATQSPDLLLVPFGWAAGKEAWPEHGNSLSAWIVSTARRAGCPVVGTDLVGIVSSGPWEGMTYGGQSAVALPDGTVVGKLRDRDMEVRVFEIAVQGRAPDESKP